MSGESQNPFSPRVMIAVILVGVFAFSGFALLGLYAGELRGGDDGGGHPLSKSAIGFQGAVVMAQAQGVPVVISRDALTDPNENGALRVLTPDVDFDPKALQAYNREGNLLVVLPKWSVQPDPRHQGWVRKIDLVSNLAVQRPISDLSRPAFNHRKGVTRPRLSGAGGPFGEGTYLPLGPVDRLQTIAGPDFHPVLTDEEGRMVLAVYKDTQLLVLADPDLLNTQGLKDINTARAGMAILNVLRGDGGLAFDVTPNGFMRTRNPLKLALEPPLLGGTLCLLAAIILMGVHAAVRFGPARTGGRALALGKAALIDSSAGLIHAAGKAHELTPAYAALIEARVAKAAGDRETDPAARTARLMRQEAGRSVTTPLSDLLPQARSTTNRNTALTAARKLFQWKSEMTRDRR
jgi:hypothetical protein